MKWVIAVMAIIWVLGMVMVIVEIKRPNAPDGVTIIHPGVQP